MDKVTLHPVDQLGAIRAQIANLRTQEKKIEEKLKEKGAGAYEGELFRATVSIAPRETVSWKEVAMHFEPSVQLVTAHTTKSEVVSIRLTAKLTDKGA